MAEKDLIERLIDKVLRPLIGAFREPLEVSDEAIGILASDLSKWLRDQNRHERVRIQKRQLLVMASVDADCLRVLLFSPSFQVDTPDPNSFFALFDGERSGISILPPRPNHSGLQTPLSEILGTE